jgi:hypothetical protein
MFAKRIPLQSVIINDIVVSQFGGAITITPIKMMIKLKVDIGILHQLHRIDLGSRALNCKLINRIVGGQPTVAGLIAEFNPTEKGIVNPNAHPELTQYNRVLFVVGSEKGVKKVKQIRTIKRELLEKCKSLYANETH